MRTASPESTGHGIPLRREVTRARSDFRVSDVTTQEELVRGKTIRERLLAMLGLFFAGVALLLAGIGLYGVLDYRCCSDGARSASAWLSARGRPTSRAG